jgi:type I restriction enzyme R subunit
MIPKPQPNTARVWSGTGIGKTLSMLFCAISVVRHPAMQSPTLVLLTDRNDLDDQLLGQFQRCHDILGQTPVLAESRERLRELLQVSSGGVIFTTIQNFLPEKGAQMSTTGEPRQRSRST